MNQSILHNEVQDYITSHLEDDITSLLLKGESIQNVDAKAIIEQIESKRKSKYKLPSWYNTKGIYFPNKLNIEQTSSELTAKYKSELISGEQIVDITGGFGVDCYYFSKQFSKVIHCEINSSLSKIVSHNNNTLGTTNIVTQSIDGLEYLKQVKNKVDWIYTDPSRRHEQKGKVFFLEDCLPNIPENLDLLFSKTDQIIIKTSPLLDISIGLKSLKFVESIHVVSVKNEVKELLWVLKKDFLNEVNIIAVNINNEKEDSFSFKLKDEQKANPKFSQPLSYLYEPNSAIFKAGAFKLLATNFNLKKLNSSSHLYTSDNLVEFPGRRFKIEKIVPFNKKLLKKECPLKANVSIRNFPESVASIRKKLGIKDGGEKYLFFTTNLLNEKIVIFSSKAD